MEVINQILQITCQNKKWGYDCIFVCLAYLVHIVRGRTICPNSDGARHLFGRPKMHGFFGFQRLTS